MQTDMSPIDDSYDPIPPMMPSRVPRSQQQQSFFNDDEPEEQHPRFLQQQPQYFVPQQQSFQQFDNKRDNFFGQIDKMTWVIIGLLVLIAFFMGKTMQPVILKT